MMMFPESRHINIAKYLSCLFGMLLPVTMAGCAGVNWLNWQQMKIVEATESNPVSNIICIWEPAEGHGLDGLPTRGIAGQIMFFTKQTPTPVLVDGDVRVYLYDDRGTVEERSKPIHQFDFIGDAWKVHLRPSTLGPAYNVFIPYVRKHKQQVTCGLQLRIKQKVGSNVFSQLVNVTLPGFPVDESQNNSIGTSENNVDSTGHSSMKSTPVGALIRNENITLTQKKVSSVELSRGQHLLPDSSSDRQREELNDLSERQSALMRIQELTRELEIAQAQAAHAMRDESDVDVTAHHSETVRSPVSMTANRNTDKDRPESRSHRLSPVAHAGYEVETDVDDEESTFESFDIRNRHPLEQPPKTTHPLLD